MTVFRDDGRVAIRLGWTCSDYVRHGHRSRFTAWICGRFQRAGAWLRDWADGDFW